MICADCGTREFATLTEYGRFLVCPACRSRRERVRDGAPLRSHRRVPDTEPKFKGRRYSDKRPLLTCDVCSVPLLPHEHPNVFRPSDHLDSPRAPRNPPVCSDCARDATNRLIGVA